eukprot:3482584-Pleurochrysis_carterae.AAC.3
MPYSAQHATHSRTHITSALSAKSPPCALQRTVRGVIAAQAVPRRRFTCTARHIVGRAIVTVVYRQSTA